MIKDLPDEMYDETMQVVEDIRNAAAAIVDLHIAVFSMLELDGLTRKDQANLILQKCRIPFEIENVIRIDLNSGIMFSLLDGKHDVVLKKTWDLVKPESNDLICKSDLLG
jgi:hypothetical protein